MRLICRTTVAAAMALIAAAGTAQAIVLVPMTTAEMVDVADWVIRGTVGSVTVDWNESHTMVYTSITIRVTECYGPNAQPCPEELVICQPGGRVGSRVCVVPGMPKYKKSEDVVVFLKRARRKRLAKHDIDYLPVGAVQGKYAIGKDGRAERDWTGATFVKKSRPEAGITLDELVKEITQALRTETRWE